MPLVKFTPTAGVNRENTRYASEGKWWEADKIRFRQGTPEAIGGWIQVSNRTYLGTCRSLNSWVLLNGTRVLGVGTSEKFYIYQGGAYYDISPIRRTVTLANPFTATAGSSTLTITDVAHDALVGDFVTFSGAVGLGGVVTDAELNKEYVVASVVDADHYTVTMSVTADVTDAAGSPGGGVAVVAAYQIHPGYEFQVPVVGWGAGVWSAAQWGVGQAAGIRDRAGIRLWTQANFGEDLIYGYAGGPMYYWDASLGLTSRGVAVTSMVGASDVPLTQNHILVSDVSRFTLAFGCTDIGSTTLDPLLIRWSDQESVTNWTPAITNQAGGIRLSNGSAIVTAIQVRQEIAVWTDTAMYSLQYVGTPYVWSPQLLGDNISIISSNAAVIASGVAFWMGVDKFYVYDGRVQTLNCDLRKFIYSDINITQAAQVFAGTNEGFNEVWWFYCAADSTTINRYVVYNYMEKVWYYGSMARTAWIDSAIEDRPIAATYSKNLVQHEVGVDDVETGTAMPIHSYVSSAEFDIGDGHSFGFIWRALPDLTFTGSTEGSDPEVTITIYPMLNSGSGATGVASANVLQGASYVVTEEFTGQVGMRVRGRQMIFKVESNKVGTTWQLGATRLDVRPDGRR